MICKRMKTNRWHIASRPQYFAEYCSFTCRLQHRSTPEMCKCSNSDCPCQPCQAGGQLPRQSVSLMRHSIALAVPLGAHQVGNRLYQAVPIQILVAFFCYWQQSVLEVSFRNLSLTSRSYRELGVITQRFYRRNRCNHTTLLGIPCDTNGPTCNPVCCWYEAKYIPLWRLQANLKTKKRRQKTCPRVLG